jgi:hypothetical protein
VKNAYQVQRNEIAVQSLVFSTRILAQKGAHAKGYLLFEQKGHTILLREYDYKFT